MKNKDMLKAIGNIDEKFIANAQVHSDEKPIREKNSTRKWVKWAGAIAAVLVVCVVGVGALSSSFMFMGASKSADQEAMSLNGSYGYRDVASVGMKSEGSYKANDAQMELSEAPSYSQETLTDSNANLAKQEVKLIYTADIHLQTTKYEETFGKLSALVDQMGGYFEKSSIENGTMYYSGYKSGYYTIRVPSENFRMFLDAAGNDGHVVSLQENVRDVGEVYFNIESQIETLKIKEERLQELLKKAENLGDIITLESELSNVEQMLKMYGTDLNHYDSLIGYSTINLTLEEVSAYSDSAYKESFGTRFIRASKRGVVNFVEGVQDFIIWIGSNIIGLVILAVIIFVIWKFHIIRRIIRKIAGKQ